MLMRADTHIDLKVPGTEKEKPKCTLSQVLAALAVSLGSMIVGFVSSYTSPAIPSMQAPDSTISVSNEEASWIAGLMPLSALVGGIIGGPLIEHLGRKRTILALGFPFVIAALLIAFAVNVWMIFVGRAITGLSVGAASLSLPVYLAETVQPEVRGTLGLLPTTIGNIGILITYVAGSYLDWSQLALLGGCLAFPFIVSMFLIPETPRWYIAKDRPKDALAALQWLRGKNTDVAKEMHDIEQVHIVSKKQKNRPSQLFRKPFLKPLCISLGLMACQQLSGINAVIFYTVTIFDEAGSSLDGHVASIIIGVVNLLACFIATALIDRLGRKALLYISDAFMILSLGVLGTFFYLKNEAGFDVTSVSWLPLVAAMVYVLSFSLGFGPIPWIMMGEIFPAQVRGSAAAFATAFNWSCTFLVTKTFSDLKEAMGIYGVFWLFAAICLAGVFFVIFCVPETQGQSLEDIEKHLTGPFRRVSSAANFKPLPLSL